MVQTRINIKVWIGFIILFIILSMLSVIVNFTDGFTPLMALCNSTKSTAKESLKCLELLIQAKADANVTNRRK